MHCFEFHFQKSLHNAPPPPPLYKVYNTCYGKVHHSHVRVFALCLRMSRRSYIYGLRYSIITIVRELCLTPPPPLPLSLSISAGVHNWIVITSVPATSSGSKEAKTDIKSYRKRKKNTCKYPTILCQRCPDTLSCYGGVLILCPVMEVS